MRSPASSRFVDVSCDLLGGGYAVRFRASGGSMRPAICDGDVVTVAPGAAATLVHLVDRVSGYNYEAQGQVRWGTSGDVPVIR
jgi:hypothetical protein